MNEIEADLLRMIYELSEIVWHECAENSFPRERIQRIREHIRDTYDESTYR